LVLICATENHGWPANFHGLSRGWFGPYEVNWDYYTSWIGDDRIVILDTARALKLGVIPGQLKPSAQKAPRQGLRIAAG
jgi:hypothetical protein